MMNGGVLPVTRFPRVDDADKAKEGQRALTIRAWSKHEHLIHHTCISSRAVVSAVIPFGACIIGTDQVRSGDGEVDVLGTFVVEVVVLSCSRVDGRGTCDLGDGSGTCSSFGEVHGVLRS